MDSRSLAYRFEGDAYRPSRQYREVLSRAPFERPSPRPQEHQSQVLSWCRWFAQNGYGELGLPLGQGGDPFRFACLGHELGLFDPSLMMRFGLQFGFVLRAVSRLGSERQRPWLSRIASMEAVTCLAMTEHHHGSHVRGMRTMARFQGDHYSLTTHDPKDYVTAALSSDLALVFAQIESDGQQHGVHAFLVSLRTSEGALQPGVTIEDIGLMGGLNGLDYGRIHLQDVRVPNDHLLERHGYVDGAGAYHCNLPSPAHRLNALMGTLAVGRSLLSAGASAGAKRALSIAISYAQSRRQFAPSGQSAERTLLSYQAHQRKLMPLLASLMAVEAGRLRLAQVQHEKLIDAPGDRKQETFTAALKSYTSNFAVEVSRVTRNTCGGAGCLASAKLTSWRNDLDLFTTMEGDNTVLDLLVARNILTDFQRGLDGPRLVKALSWAGKGVQLAAQTGPIRSKNPDQLTTQEFFDKALRFRLHRLRYSLGRRVKVRLASGLPLGEALADCQDHSLELARAYCEEKIYRLLRNLTESCPPGWDQSVLGRLLALFALSRIEESRGWFLEQGYLKPRQSEAIRDQVLKLCAQLAQEAEVVVRSFELTERLLDSNLVSV